MAAVCTVDAERRRERPAALPRRPIAGVMPRVQLRPDHDHRVGEFALATLSQLDHSFRHGSVYEIPDGEAEGSVIPHPGMPARRTVARFIHDVVWRGAVFDAATRTLHSLVSPAGLRVARGPIRRERSWFDRRACLAASYPHRAGRAPLARAEMRLLSPGSYLGRAYVRLTPTIYATCYFTLRFPG